MKFQPQNADRGYQKRALRFRITGIVRDVLTMAEPTITGIHLQIQHNSKCIPPVGGLQISPSPDGLIVVAFYFDVYTFTRRTQQQQQQFTKTITPSVPEKKPTKYINLIKQG
jgi:hypothetical protein